jgi:preprotein translocase subunit YajC
MSNKITLIYTEPLLKQAVFAFWRRTVGTGFFVVLVLIACSFIFLLWRGDRSWLVGAIGAIIVFALLLAALVYFIHLRNTLRKFRAMGTLTATLEIDDATFTVSSPLGNTTLSWSAVTELWCFPTFWLLLFSKAQFITIPLVSVSNQTQDAMLNLVSKVGGKIVR